ncbi:hypothetical protein [uncultured Roseobacter sp.]|uniref:hypothetical protein n=1 Tax=uncultured Roseobacter sp. TaxID=114847 RepID=UPI002632BD99|nr:hypothetical protein [uncultured Roseobacter sp.]
MRIGISATCCAVALSGCAEDNLFEAERQVVDRLQLDRKIQITPQSELTDLARYSRAMSVAYRNAARKTASTQDVQSFLIFVAAGSFVTGAVGSASDRALANRAIAGAGVQQIGLRTAPKSAISGMYTGAKRLNCIATVATVGLHTLPSDEKTQKAASALVFGATEEVRITTRESLVREVADYAELVTALTPPPPTEDVGALAAPQKPAIVTFSENLEKCLKKKEESAD